MTKLSLPASGGTCNRTATVTCIAPDPDTVRRALRRILLSRWDKCPILPVQPAFRNH